MTGKPKKLVQKCVEKIGKIGHFDKVSHFGKGGHSTSFNTYWYTSEHIFPIEKYQWVSVIWPLVTFWENFSRIAGSGRAGSNDTGLKYVPVSGAESIKLQTDIFG